MIVIFIYLFTFLVLVDQPIWSKFHICFSDLAEQSFLEKKETLCFLKYIILFITPFRFSYPKKKKGG